ncbi:MAG: AlwI family type II restriction endonuclease, partial [Lachnospiraceae bacterium]|nr:AlwI family type II restriction endonuclease [Lachnospiraceae bacterium]
PVFVNDEDKYKEYLFDEKFPVFYSDDKERLSRQISNITGDALQTKSMSLDELKDLLEDEIRIRKRQIIQKEVEDIKQYKVYSDVMTVFDDIKGNMPDINETFNLAVEVTMQSGQKQYEMEGEPVSRHLAKLKAEGGKEAYCLFIAPKINPSCIAFFYALHKMNIAYYGGSSVIVPMELNVFINLLEQSYRADYVPDSIQIKEIFQYSMELADKSVDENEWYEKLKEKALNWL